MTIALHDSNLWPLRLTRSEVARIIRISDRELRRRIFEGRFPKPDDGKTWDRDVVIRYVKGGIRQLEREAERRQMRGQLSVVGGRR
jgi:hypothetical protein